HPTPPTATYTLSLHDALPISSRLTANTATTSRTDVALSRDRYGSTPFGSLNAIGTRSAAPSPSVAIARSAMVSDQGAARNRVGQDRKSTRLNSSHVAISYAVF